MAKRLNARILAKEPVVGQIGSEICRNCGGGIVVDAADHRTANVPHRRVCRTCGVEYGTTRATLYPGRAEYESLPERFRTGGASVN
jgi:hypothetical protein